ncbi:MAG: HEAT repeat domain-containing protein [Terriglobia bacterium]
MPVLAEQAIHAIYVLSLIIFLFTLALILFALIRRKTRQRYYQQLDKLRQECQPILEGMLAGSIAYDSGLAQLKVQCHSSGAAMLQRVLAEARSTAGPATLRQISTDLGFIRAWQRGLASPAAPRTNAIRPRSGWRGLWPWPGFPDRAQAAEYLGVLRHQPSWRLMLRALNDANADVRTTAVRAVGAIGEPRAFPVLLEALRDAATSGHPKCSVATLRQALARFPLHLASAVSPLLRDPDPRIRFLGAEVIQEMVKHAATVASNLQLTADNFPAPVLDALVVELSHDPSANVRARVAMVLGYIADSRAAEAMTNLLEDREWLVRLQAVKSAGRSGAGGLERPIAACLSDADWRVREAAAHALGQHSRPGADLVLNQFLETRDVYMKEQIAEEVERSGLINGWLSHLGEAGCERQTQALSQLVEMGKTGFLQNLLTRPISDALRARLSASLGLRPMQKRQAAGH